MRTDPTIGERIRDHLRAHQSLSCPQARRLWPEVPARTIANSFYGLRDAGVIVPLPGRYPRSYRIARLAVEAA